MHPYGYFLPLPSAYAFLQSPKDYCLSISATTRMPRLGEKEGREYFFHTKEEFEELIEKDGLIEWAEYVGNYYGTPRAYVEKQLREGNNIILEIEQHGAFRVKELYIPIIAISSFLN